MSTMTYNSLNTDIQEYLDRNDAVLLSQIPEFICLGEIRCAREVKNLLLKTAVVALFQPGQSVYKKPDRWLQVVSLNFGNNPGFNTVSRQLATGTATLTCSTPVNFTVGQAISVFNVQNSAYNGNWTVSAVTQYSVSYSIGSGTEALTADTLGVVTPQLNSRSPILPRSLEYCNYYWPDRTQVGTPKFYADYDYNNWLVIPTPTIAAPYEVVMYQRPVPLSPTQQENIFTQYCRDLLLYATLLETAPYLKNDARIPVWKQYFEEAKAALIK